MGSRELLSKRLSKMLTARQQQADQGMGLAAPGDADPLMQAPMPPELPNPFALGQSTEAASEASSVSIGNRARSMVNRAEFIAQIEKKLSSHAASTSISLKPYGLERKPGELPDTWEDLDSEVESKKQIKPIVELKLGQLPATTVPVNPAPQPLRGLAADLHALEIIKQRARTQANVLAAAGKPKRAPRKPKATEVVAKPPAQPDPVVPKAPPVRKKAVDVAQAPLAQFMATPAHLELQSRAQLDLATFFLDEFQVQAFRSRVLAEKQQQTQLKPSVFDPSTQVLDFQVQAGTELVSHTRSALFNEQEFEDWVESLEREFPPLYQQEKRFEPTEISRRTRDALKMLPLLGRNVTVGSMLNSWKLMGQMGRNRSLVIQPDFVRLDTQETLEHELFLGQSGLPAHRNHTLFKPTESQGYLSATAIHLFRPRQLVAPHEDAELFMSRIHPLTKRHIAQEPFSAWFERVFTTNLSHATLIESWVGEVVSRYSMMHKKLLKQARVVSQELIKEYEGGDTGLRQNTAFNMRFYQCHGFLPAASFYEFLQCPVRPGGTWGASIPLWQALGQGHVVGWNDVILEEQPMDLLLLHFLAVFAQGPRHHEGLLGTLALLDVLMRCGDYFDAPQQFASKADQLAMDRSLGSLKAYEQVLSDEALKHNPNPSHNLGSYRVAWDRHTKATPADGAYLSAHQEVQLVESFAGLKSTLQNVGVWRDDIAHLIELSQIKLANVEALHGR
ncbi:hypothetical protein NQT62_13940 [Limnobacter humi]|uniref:Uncharacterized protein n=1 Tax=Limnobacter humi TaxID=1778671 RepID=A0ABT1WJ66_9BURK|nr:hypothetical protein [Limnobacter humi]MCQ8897538.1 hypothetical protein [Limnobacter humi]